MAHSAKILAHSISPDGIPLTMWFGNFRGWVQHRKEISGEADMQGAR